MDTIATLAADFLAQQHIAVTGVSDSRSGAALSIFRKLRDSGHQVYPIHPSQASVDGTVCHPGLDSLPRVSDAIVIINRPSVCLKLVRQCIKLGIPRVWMHHPFGTHPSRFGRLSEGLTSVSPLAVALCRRHGIKVIPGGCPMMFCEPVDPAHRCLRWVNRMTGAFTLSWMDSQ